MRNVLIATAGLALLAAPIAALAQDDLEFKGPDRVTVCEVQGSVIKDVTSVADVRMLRGGFDPDITIDDVEPLFSGSAGIDLCEALAEKETRQLCKKATRRDKKAVLSYNFLYGFKRLVEDPAPPPAPCTGPTDPRCFDPAITQFRMETFKAGFASGFCAELLRR